MYIFLDKEIAQKTQQFFISPGWWIGSKKLFKVGLKTPPFCFQHHPSFISSTNQPSTCLNHLNVLTYLNNFFLLLTLLPLFIIYISLSLLRCLETSSVLISYINISASVNNILDFLTFFDYNVVIIELVHQYFN